MILLSLNSFQKSAYSSIGCNKNVRVFTRVRSGFWALPCVIGLARVTPKSLNFVNQFYVKWFLAMLQFLLNLLEDLWVVLLCVHLHCNGHSVFLRKLGDALLAFDICVLDSWLIWGRCGIGGLHVYWRRVGVFMTCSWKLTVILLCDISLEVLEVASDLCLASLKIQNHVL